MSGQNINPDIVVIGGGTAGSAAAVAAARRGCKVLLVEELNCLGGVATSGGVGEWFAGLEGLGNIFDTLRAEMRRAGMHKSKFFNPEYLKNVWQWLAEEAGVQILFHASLAGVRKDAGRVTGVELLACSQPVSVAARYFIDASGEGDLAALAGAEFQQGQPGTGRTLHMTLTFLLHDTGQPVTPWLPPGVEPLTELPGLKGTARLPDGRVYCNMTKVLGCDPTDPVSLTQAELEARRQLIGAVHLLQSTQYPTYTLSSSGATIGIREGRRIIGDFILTQDQILDRTESLAFDDGVAVATCQIDFHSLNKAGSQGWRQKVMPYNIPFRCLTAKGFSNLLMAGKCISVDQVVHSSSRMTPTCCMMGQAAGTAAALAFKQNATDIRVVPIEQLRAALTQDGMELDPRQHHPFAPHSTRLETDDKAI